MELVLLKWKQSYVFDTYGLSMQVRSSISRYVLHHKCIPLPMRRHARPPLYVRPPLFPPRKKEGLRLPISIQS